MSPLLSPYFDVVVEERKKKTKNRESRGPAWGGGGYQFVISHHSVVHLSN